MPYKTGTWGEKAKARSKQRNKYFKQYKKRRDPIKVNARRVIEYLLKRKIIFKMPCVECGKIKVEAHHPDYSKPLEIIWLCPPHHREKDRELHLRK